MRTWSPAFAAAIIVGVAITTVACDRSRLDAPRSSIRGLVRVDGSSTVGPLTEAAAEDLLADRARHSSVGRSLRHAARLRAMDRRGALMSAMRHARSGRANSSALGKPASSLSSYPIAYDGITFVVGRDNDWLRTLTLRDLRRLFLVESQATVRDWRDLRPRVAGAADSAVWSRSGFRHVPSVCRRGCSRPRRHSNRSRGQR